MSANLVLTFIFQGFKLINSEAEISAGIKREQKRMW